MKILFIANGSIGDVVMSTGLIGYLMDTYPSATFTIAASAITSSVFNAMPQLDRLIIVRKLPYHKHWLNLWREVCKERWDLVVDMRASALSYFLRAKKRKIFHSNDRALSKLDQLAALFGLSPAPQPRLWVSATAIEKAERLTPSKPFMVMIPKSNSSFKDWPIERYAELANRLLAKPELSKATVVVLALAQQKDSVQPLISALPSSHVLDLSGKTDIETAMAILKQATLVIGGDSGLLHIAGALRAPLIGLYGPTNDKKYAPKGPHVRIAKVQDFADEEREIQDPTIITRLSVDKVEAAVYDLLSSLAASSAA